MFIGRTNCSAPRRTSTNETETETEMGMRAPEAWTVPHMAEMLPVVM